MDVKTQQAKVPIYMVTIQGLICLIISVFDALNGQKDKRYPYLLTIRESIETVIELTKNKKTKQQ